jgi:large subunit ribosomal protein L6
MSRVGKQPIAVPEKVTINVDKSTVKVKGPLGELQRTFPDFVGIAQKDKQVLVTADRAAAPDAGAQHGMTRARIANMLEGVATGFRKNLDIVGLGFKAQVAGTTLELTIGFSHPVKFSIPKGITLEVDKKLTKLTVIGIDKDLVGETAARIRALKPPEPYKGTGIRYEGERIIKKAGKTAAGAGAGAGGGAKK